MTPNTGGPAFPSAAFEQHEYTGMTLRDYFAAKAIHGLIRRKEAHLDDKDFLAEEAYEFADALLKAREA